MRERGANRVVENFYDTSIKTDGRSCLQSGIRHVGQAGFGQDFTPPHRNVASVPGGTPKVTGQHGEGSEQEKKENKRNPHKSKLSIDRRSDFGCDGKPQHGNVTRAEVTESLTGLK
ncbi:von Willebrand factor D and EGF domain-containing protein-like protein [Anopheles sinensis]|uniref:von Willebrand factor D and EGF domain-containing protein-like protein n=1 Tax=Anopheles sinensis TaxID=74873 RepID=A0A084WBR5_ANOSI|nr:von Willebrand factor D and EGF domain-containing protein-like protein [Anopheles sinensis]